MNYRKPELQERLASEYVLGTLRGMARKRFERLMVADAVLRRSVAEWEARLMPLSDAIEPIAPPRELWRRIVHRVHAMRPAPSPWSWQGVFFWRAWTGGFAALAMAMLVVTLGVTTRPASVKYIPAPQMATANPVQYVAVLQDQASKVAMVVSAADAHGRVRVLPMSPELAQLVKDRDFELWALPAGGAPKSLGLVGGGGKTELAATAQRIANVPLLAISLEPKGGSKTGLPTGPVLYTGKLLAM